MKTVKRSNGCWFCKKHFRCRGLVLHHSVTQKSTILQNPLVYDLFIFKTEFNLGEKAKKLKSLLASILAMQENLIALDALENLVSCFTFYSILFSNRKQSC